MIIDGITRVLHVTGAMNMGGAEVMLMDMLRFKSQNFHFDFLINYNKKYGLPMGDFDDEIEKYGSTIFHIPAQWEIGPWIYAKQLKSICEIIKPDIIHIHMNAKSGVIAWAAYKAGIKKIIVHSHADLKIRGHWLKVLLSKLELVFQKRLIVKYATNFWGCSHEANASLFYPRCIEGNKSAVIKNAIDCNKFNLVDRSEAKKLRDSFGFSDSTLILGNVGRVVRHKNIAFILQILEEYKKRGDDVAFVVAGRASDQVYMKEFWDQADKRGVTEQIRYLGIRSDIEIVMSTFDVFLGPALQEGFGLVAVEAQAAEVPVLLYKGFPKSVDMKQGIALILNSFNVEEWINSIDKLRGSMPNSSMIDAIKKKGFDVRDNTKKVEKLYQNI